MHKIFVDTCVWRHWFTFIAAKPLPQERIRQHCESFHKIYDLVRSAPDQACFLYNKRIEDELGESLKSEFNKHALPLSQKIPIPLTRCDGTYCFDGSIIFGGEMGGKLRDLLSIQGYPHELKLEQAANDLKEGDFLYNTTPRKREFDIEHLESALEARADLFITNDEKTILAWLQSASPKYDESHPINLINKISKTPTSALLCVQHQLSSPSRL